MSMRGRSGSQPNKPWFLIRTVIEDKRFEEQKKKITPDVRRFDEILFGVAWAVARGPEQFPQALEKPDIRVIKTDPLAGIPRLRIFFTFDDDEVHLKWIEVIEEEEEGG